MNRTRNLILCLVGVTFLSCGRMYYDRNSEQFRVFNQRKDKNFVGQEQLKSHPFDLDKYLHPDCDTCVSIQYVTPSDIKAIIREKGNLLVIFYFPVCKAAEGYVKLAKAVEERGVPYILISIANNPDIMKKWHETLALKNRNCYIIPSDVYGDYMMTKKIRFISELCPTCYIQYKDELIYTLYVFIKNKGNTFSILNLENNIYTPEDALQWIIQNYTLDGN